MRKAILAFLREQLGESLPHCSGVSKQTPRTFQTPKSENVRGVKQLPFETRLSNAFEDVQNLTPSNVRGELQALYLSWKTAFLGGFRVHTARGGARFLHQEIRIKRRYFVSVSGLDALVDLFCLLALQDGLIKKNPRYTGFPPYPKYLRVLGVNHD